SQGVAAWLRHHGAEAETLDGGFLAWVEPGMMLYDPFFRWSREAVQETHNWPAGRAA
ncbi:MAG: hypothetical protein JWR00_1382, partial [Rubritepida sp.]|nr:hypothetical protein [Rubritepida sp.]